MSDSTHMKSYVIPILLEKGGRYIGGSAFLGALGDAVYLVTAAHGATMVSNSPTRWDEWSTQFTVCAKAGGASEDFVIELFRSDSFGNRIPRFHYTNHPSVPGHVVDLMLVPLDEELHRLGSYPRINLEKSTPPHVTDIVTSWGFPTAGDLWPTQQSTSGPIYHIPSDVPQLLFVSMPSEEGYSGAPAFKSDGSFVGIVIGHTNGDFPLAQIIPPGFIRAALPHPGGSLTNGDYSSF